MCSPMFGPRRVTVGAQEREAFMKPIRDNWKKKVTPINASPRIWDDGIIAPETHALVLGLGCP